MADDQETSNEEGEVPDYDADETETTTTFLTTTTPVPVIEEEAAATTTSVVEDYADEEPLPDVTVNLYINELPEGAVLPTDLVNAGMTDIYGQFITPSTTPWYDSINGYTSSITQGVYNELNGTDIGGKRWLGSWTWNKILFVGLIALCIIGIILAIVFLVIGKKFKRNKRSPGPTTTTKAVVTKGPAPGTKYEAV